MKVARTVALRGAGLQRCSPPTRPRLGGNVRKGEHGAKVCYFDKLTREKLDQQTGETTEQRIAFIKTYTVFSAEQCEGLPQHFLPPPELAPTPAAVEARLAHAEAFIAHTGAAIRHGGDRACYSAAADLITMPPFPAFATPYDYYATLLHELVHLTKHPSRLDRDCGRKQWGDEGYAMEELVAEVGSAFLCADLGIATHARDDHASYIASWLAVLKKTNAPSSKPPPWPSTPPAGSTTSSPAPATTKHTHSPTTRQARPPPATPSPLPPSSDHPHKEISDDLPARAHRRRRRMGETVA